MDNWSYIDNWNHTVDKFGIQRKPVNPYTIWLKDTSDIFIKDPTRTILIPDLELTHDPFVYREKVLSLWSRLFRIFKKLIFHILES